MGTFDFQTGIIEKFLFLKQIFISEPWKVYSSSDNSMVSDSYFLNENIGLLGFGKD
jgi:hypothetical protein